MDLYLRVTDAGGHIRVCSIDQMAGQHFDGVELHKTFTATASGKNIEVGPAAGSQTLPTAITPYSGIISA